MLAISSDAAFPYIRFVEQSLTRSASTLRSVGGLEGVGFEAVGSVFGLVLVKDFEIWRDLTVLRASLRNCGE